MRFPALQITSDIKEALASARIVCCAVPSKFLRSVLQQMRLGVPTEALILSATKGLECQTLCRPSQVFASIFGQPILDRLAVLAGPSFAVEVARQLPTAVTVASTNHDMAEDLQHLLSGLLDWCLGL